jgi:hypothetical protein
MKRVLLFLIFIILFNVYDYAQDTNDMSQDQILLFKRQVAKMVDQFNDEISIISGSRTRYVNENRKRIGRFYINDALKLFIGQGKGIVNMKGVGIHEPIIEVSRNNVTTKNTVRKFLNNLANHSFYCKVKVTSCDVYLARNEDALRISGDSCKVTFKVITLSYKQNCYGVGEYEAIYKDKVDKTIILHPMPDEVIDHNIIPGYGCAFLGDMVVTVTNKK